MPRRLVVNIRGANASGKTTLARKILGSASVPLDLWCTTPDGLEQSVRINRCVVRGLELPVYVLGTYDQSKYSGCDKIKSADLIDAAVRKMAGTLDGHVLFEGFRVSKSWTRFAAVRNWAVKNTPVRWVWAFLRAEPELIFERSQARRSEDSRPIDKKELAAVCRVMESTRRKAKMAFPAEVLDLQSRSTPDELCVQLVGWMIGQEGRP